MNKHRLPPHRIPEHMIKQIPGPILLPARFVLASDKQDLADWDEPDTLWIEDTSYWLYVFCQDQTEKTNLVRFACEIFVDAQGEMHEVNLKKLWSAAKRPAPDTTTSNVIFQIGYALITSVVQPYDVWIWASPFQMARSRLPPLSDLRTCPLSVFQKWANLRNLDPMVLPTERFEGHALAIPVEPPWIHAFALNRAVARHLDVLDARLNEKGLKERFLYSAIRRLPNFALHVHEKRYSDFYGEVLHDELVSQQGLDEATIKLVGFLEDRTFVSMWSDMVASEDPSAWPKMHVISARSYHRLWEARAAVPHLSRVAEKQGKFLESSFSSMLALKNARKVGKAYWNLVKTFVTTSKHEGTLPKWAIKACQDFAEEHYGVALVLAKTGADGKALKKVFTEESVRELAKKSTERVIKTGFVAFVEVINALVVANDLASAVGESDMWKKRVAAIGAASTAFASLADLTVAFAKSEIGDGGGMAPLAKAKAYVVHHEGKVRMAKALLGATASAADVYLGLENAHEAKSTGDDRAALFHGATALGGAVGVIGYLMMAGGATAPVGAVLVFLGSAMGTGGGIGAAIFHDSDLDEWVKFCKWGRLATDPKAGKDGDKDIERPWSEGPLRTLSDDLDRQIRTLNNLVHRLKVELKFAFTGDGHRLGIDVLMSMQFLGDKSTVWLEVTMNGHTVRPWAPWKTGASANDVRASFHEHFHGPDSRAASIRLRVDMFGDRTHWFPSKDLIVTAESTRFGPEVFAPPYVEPT